MMETSIRVWKESLGSRSMCQGQSPQRAFCEVNELEGEGECVMKKLQAGRKVSVGMRSCSGCCWEGNKVPSPPLLPALHALRLPGCSAQTS